MMTQEEKLIHARQAAAAAMIAVGCHVVAKGILEGKLDHDSSVQSALYALDHLDEPIVDPDLIEARKMMAEWYSWDADKYLAGKYDNGEHVPIALAAIRRGRSLERGE